VTRLSSITLLFASLVLAPAAHAEDERPFFTLASTTSTRDSGLFEHLLPRFEAKTGVSVRVVAVGTGQALELGRRGDADVLLVHDRASEEAFVAQGFGLARHDVMYNDFVLAGPAADPAGVRGAASASDALGKIAAAKAPFASRGDDSGTHKAELRLWQAAGVDPRPASGTWYRETGGGMGATLGVAGELGAYVLTDRATWASYRSRRGLAALVEGDPRLRNPYGVIVVDPKRHAHAKAELAGRFADWLRSEEGRSAIASFRVGGAQVFFVETEAR
jgi:tungstate transport system substrate-binding protein